MDKVASDNRQRVAARSCIWFVMGEEIEECYRKGTCRTTTGLTLNATNQSMCEATPASVWIEPCHAGEEYRYEGWVQKAGWNQTLRFAWQNETGPVVKKASYEHMYSWAFSDSFLRSASVETAAEKWVLVLLDVFQSLVFAAIAGFIFSKVDELRASSVEYETKMSQLKEYARAVNLPRGLRSKLLATFMLIYENKSVFDEEAILAELPQHTRSEVVRFLHGEKIEGNMFFFGLEHNEAAVMKICMKLRSTSALMNDEVYSEGDIGEDM
jgi:hypothetical protein